MDNNKTIYEPARKKIKGTGILIQKAALIIVSDNFFSQCFILDKDKITIGREKSCNICLNDSHISNVHCQITLSDDGHHYLEDLESRNGTFLNKIKIKKSTQLYYLDRIVIGQTIIRYFLEEKLSNELL